MFIAGLYPPLSCAAQYFGARDQLPFRAMQIAKVGCSAPSLFCQLFLDCKVKTVYHMQVIYNKVKEASAE